VLIWPAHDDGEAESADELGGDDEREVLEVLDDMTNADTPMAAPVPTTRVVVAVLARAGWLVLAERLANRRALLRSDNDCVGKLNVRTSESQQHVVSIAHNNNNDNDNDNNNDDSNGSDSRLPHDSRHDM
jgi:hypothetical protein